MRQVNRDTDVVPTAHYEDRDRLRTSYGSARYDQAITAAEESGKVRQSADYWEIFFRTLLDKPQLRLVHIQSAYNQSTGHPYQVFGYIPE